MPLTFKCQPQTWCFTLAECESLYAWLPANAIVDVTANSVKKQSRSTNIGILEYFCIWIIISRCTVISNRLVGKTCSICIYEHLRSHLLVSVWAAAMLPIYSVYC